MTDQLRPLIARCARAVYDDHDRFCVNDTWVDTECGRAVLEAVAAALGVPGVRDLQGELARFDHPQEDRSAACG